MIRRGPSSGSTRAVVAGRAPVCAVAAARVLARLLVAVGSLVLAEPSVTPARGAAIAVAADTSPARDARVQARIAAVTSATSEEQLAGALAALRAVVADDFSDLVPQLALFLIDARDERAGMTPALIVSRLGVTRGQILRAVEPYLDTPDARLRAQLENLLGEVELDDVRAFVAASGPDAPSPALVRYLYARSPVDALRVLGAASVTGPLPAPVIVVEELRGALAAGRASEADRARAAGALATLSRDSDWRLRAYVAAVLGAEPGLIRAAELADPHLETDAEPRVRAVARGMAVR